MLPLVVIARGASERSIPSARNDPMVAWNWSSAL